MFKARRATSLLFLGALLALSIRRAVIEKLHRRCLAAYQDGPKVTTAFPSGARRELERRNLDAKPFPLVAVVVLCQENASWVEQFCDRPSTVVHLVHKCSPRYPGLRRAAHDRHIVERMSWRSSYVARGSCIKHHWGHQTRGREQVLLCYVILYNRTPLNSLSSFHFHKSIANLQEAYIRQIIKLYNQIDEAANEKWAFLQGEGPEEFFLPPFTHDPVRALMDCDPRTGFASLTGGTFRPKPDVCALRPVEILLEHNIAVEVDCSRSYIVPSRGQFLVSARRIKRIPLDIWKRFHVEALCSTPGHDDFERTWALIFGCALESACVAKNKGLDLGRSGVECRDT